MVELLDLAKEIAKHARSVNTNAGFATTAAMAGVPEYMIMKQTGHKSNAIRRYIRMSNIWIENATYLVGL